MAWVEMNDRPRFQRRNLRAIDGDGGDDDDVTNELDHPIALGTRPTDGHLGPVAMDDEPEVDTRLLERRLDVEREDRLKGRKKLLVIVGILAVVVAAAVAVLTPIIGISTIEIVGIEGPGREAIKEAVEPERGKAAFWVDEAVIENRVEAIPGIADVQVVVGWPSTLTVNARPLVPVAYAATLDGRVASIDAEGTVLEIGDAVPQEIVRLENAAVPAAVGEKVPDEFLESLDVAESLTRRLTAYVVSIAMTKPTGLVLRLDPVGEVIFGDTSDLELKVRATETLLSGKVVLGCLSRIDVRVPTAATITRDKKCTGEDETETTTTVESSTSTSSSTPSSTPDDQPDESESTTTDSTENAQ